MGKKCRGVCDRSNKDPCDLTKNIEDGCTKSELVGIMGRLGGTEYLKHVFRGLLVIFFIRYFEKENFLKKEVDS